MLDQIAGPAGTMTGEQIDAATTTLKKALIERAPGGELSQHLGHPPGGERPDGLGNQRNGASAKTVLPDEDPLRIEVPRDRDAASSRCSSQSSSRASTTRSWPCTPAA